MRVLILILMTHCITNLQSQNFVNVADILEIEHYLNTTDRWGSGVSFYDIDNDGWDDITFAQESDTIYFYKNNGGIFTKTSTHIYNEGETKQVLWVDFDNDGLTDFFVMTKNGTYRLFKNIGNFQFEDISQQAGFSGFNSTNFGVSFADYDKDGYLDFYICRYYGDGDTNDLSKINNLYKNNGDGTFTNVTLEAGVGNGIAPSFQAVWLDYNNNGWSDLYVINDRGLWGNTLYRNNGDGTFTDVTSESGTLSMSDDPMSATIGDFNNNGYLDIYTTNTGGSAKLDRLFKNNFDGTFTESAQAMGLNTAAWAWGATWIDFNNNTFKDLAVTTGRLSNTLPEDRLFFYENQNGISFVENLSAFNQNTEVASFSVACGDFNNDGFPDLVVQNASPYRSYVWKNNSSNENNYVKISLEGTISNKMAIGTWIQVFAQGNKFVHYTMCGENYMSQNSQNYIFGLANLNQVDSIVVKYPSGIVDKYYEVPLNEHYFFVEGETNTVVLSPQGNTKLCEGDSLLIDAGEFQSYLWNTGDTSRFLLVYEEGNYYAEVKNSNNVTLKTDSVKVEFLNNLQISADINPPSCYDSNDGSIIVEVFPNTQEYSIVWNDTLESQNLFGVKEGVYYLNYEDNYNCSFYEEYFIVAPQEMNIQSSINFNETTSFSDVEILVNGGSPPYSYYLDSISTTIPINDLSTGNYELLVFDANNCMKQDSILIVNHAIINQIASLQEIGSKIKIFPNPLGEDLFLNIKIPNHGNETSIKIYNFLGQEVISKEFNGGQFDIIKMDCKMLSEGMYILSIKNDDIHFNFKLQK